MKKRLELVVGRAREDHAAEDLDSFLSRQRVLDCRAPEEAVARVDELVGGLAHPRGSSRCAASSPEGREAALWISTVAPSSCLNSARLASICAPVPPIPSGATAWSVAITSDSAKGYRSTTNEARWRETPINRSSSVDTVRYGNARMVLHP